MRLFLRCRGRGRDDQAGAAAVEFALITPILLLLVSGIIDYGLWFNESLNVRQGVREAARTAVVMNFDHAGCTGTDAEKLLCKTRKQIAPATGTAYVHVVLPDAGWKRGEQLLVCGMVKTTGLTGVVPLPSDGLVKSATRMSIEMDESTTLTDDSFGDPDPSGGDWSWCD